MRPLIGIPCHPAYREGNWRPIYCTNRAYVQAVEDAGGVPLLIPQVHELSALEAILSRLDGLLLPGGIDLQPKLYGEEPHPKLSDVDATIDEMELTLAHWALQENKPVLGICRGMQLLNVALGGTLYQDIDDQYPVGPENLRHLYLDLPRSQVIHEVYVESGSRVAEAVSTRDFWANSIHHQAIKEPGRGVRVTGWAKDGVIEAIEIDGRHFALAVQFHPEEIYGQISACSHLFASFVEACSVTPMPLKVPQEAPLSVNSTIEERLSVGGAA